MRGCGVRKRRRCRISTLEYYETKEIIALGAATAFVCWRSTTNEPPAVSATMILWAQILFVALIVTATMSGASQWTVQRLGFQPRIGSTAKRRAIRFWSILHVLYAKADKTLAGVANFLSDPRGPQFRRSEPCLRCHLAG
jgi:hypothetical protein